MANTLDHRYGGGYEIATFHQGKYQKYESAAYAYQLCDLEALDDDRTPLFQPPFRLSRLYYLGQTLAILNANLPFTDRINFECFYVADLLEKAVDFPPIPDDPIKLFTEAICNCLNLIVRYHGRIVAIVPIIAGARSDNPHVAIHREGANLTFRMDEHWLASELVPALRRLRDDVRAPRP